MRSAVDIRPSEEDFTRVGAPITIATKEPSSRRELRLTQVQRRGEDALRVDIRYWTLYSDGTEMPHRGGLQLTRPEAAKLLDALSGIFGEGGTQNG